MEMGFNIAAGLVLGVAVTLGLEPAVLKGLPSQAASVPSLSINGVTQTERNGYPAMRETRSAVAGTTRLLLLPAPVVAVASDGPWVAVAEGRSAHDCDRVSIWNNYRPKAFRMGRKTSCAAAGSRVAAISEIDRRVVWLHVGGTTTRTWTLWTATKTRRSPRLLARATQIGSGPPPIVLGPGNKDRGQMTYGEGDVLPYAIGRKVTALNAVGRRVFNWSAPSNVTALATEPGVLVVAVADGTVYLWRGSSREGWKQTAAYPDPVAAAHVGWDGITAVAQRGQRLQDLDAQSTGCDGSRTLRPREQLLAAGGGRIVLALGNRFRVQPGCRGRTVATGTATTVALDGDRLTFALGRRVTTRMLASP
jgi:hypothetical protein